jgi:hypothetical protein
MRCIIPLMLLELRKTRIPSQTGPVLRVYFHARKLRVKINTPATRLERDRFGFS